MERRGCSNSRSLAASCSRTSASRLFEMRESEPKSAAPAPVDVRRESCDSEDMRRHADGPSERQPGATRQHCWWAPVRRASTA
eukprot:4717899-Prymnesium_polylepis.1